MMLVPRRNDKVMKTDIKEHEDSYELLVDLPGFEKENINISIENGYLTIQAKTSSNKDDEQKGKYVRRERYAGEFSRSFYVGEDIADDDIKASFKNGILNIVIPKEEKEEVENKKYIDID